MQYKYVYNTYNYIYIVRVYMWVRAHTRIIVQCLVYGQGVGHAYIIMIAKSSHDCLVANHIPDLYMQYIIT